MSLLKNKIHIFDGGTGQTLLEKGLKPEGTLWSASALINKSYHGLVVETHLDFIDAGAELIVLVAFISPFRKDRDQVRKILKPDQFVEMYLVLKVLILNI